MQTHQVHVYNGTLIYNSISFVIKIIDIIGNVCSQWHSRAGFQLDFVISNLQWTKKQWKDFQGVAQSKIAALSFFDGYA